MGKNSQIPLFFEIISVLPLFEKYLVMYHFLKLEFDMELKFTKIEFLKKVHLELEFCLCFKLFHYLFHYLFPRDLDKRKKKEKPTATIVDCVSAIT